MAFSRPVYFAAAILAASCSSSSTGGGTATGPHYHYVASKVLVPITAGESTAYGLDLNNDGVVDNKLGGVLVDLVSLAGISAQASIDQGVLDGSIILLADLQTPDFSSAGTAGMNFYLGTNPNPPACGSGEMVTCTGSGAAETCSGCGDHLQGGASFEVTTNSNPQATGPISGGIFKAGGTDTKLSLQIALGSGTPIDLNLADAHIQAGGLGSAMIGDPSTESNPMSSSGMIVAGGILMSDLDNNIIPGLIPLLKSEQTLHCGTPAGQGSGGTSCNPSNDTTCSVLVMLMDNTCTITPASVESSAIISELLTPDLTLAEGSAISVGVKVYATNADFTVAGEGSN